MSVDETIKYQGTLEKQCKLKTWAWKKYWFVLYNEQLCYYKEKEQDSVKLVGIFLFGCSFEIFICKCYVSKLIF